MYDGIYEKQKIVKGCALALTLVGLFYCAALIALAGGFSIFGMDSSNVHLFFFSIDISTQLVGFAITAFIFMVLCPLLIFANATNTVSTGLCISLGIVTLLVNGLLLVSGIIAVNVMNIVLSFALVVLSTIIIINSSSAEKEERSLGNFYL